MYRPRVGEGKGGLNNDMIVCACVFVGEWFKISRKVKTE